MSATKFGGRIVICVLRNDLRYHDNEVLLWAHNNADHVLPIYCFDPRHYEGTWHFNFPKTGPFRLKFLLEGLGDLRSILRKAGSGLIVRRGEVEKVVPDLIQTIGKSNVHAVAFQEEVTKEELDVQTALVKNLAGTGIKKIWGSTLFHKDDIPFKSDRVPDVFTEFRKRCEGGATIRSTFQMPDQFRPLPPGIEEGNLPTMEDLGQAAPVNDSRTAFPFKGGETTGLDRIQQYFWGSNNISTYKETRNGLIGSEYSTKFSTWLAHGCLSPRKIYEEVKKYERQRTSNQSTYWVIFELIWRDYFKFVALKFGDRLFYLHGLMGVRKPWKRDQRLFDAWKDGRTGVPFVDSNMRELKSTGFMSNRGRQNVASFLTKDLGLDWRLGAEWFEYLLVDHDVCSNYGNWLYSAGVGNDPRQDRKFNMVKQGLDYDPQGDYIRQWIPELNTIRDGSVHTPWTLSVGALRQSEVSLGETYPNPIVKAPEWNRHSHRNNKGGNRGASGGGRGKGGHSRGKQRGMDFYFSSSQKK
ncbi:putative cryptochrome DASH-like [Apostichopus japonicus]|uniref:Cryptochrome DASH n=1 Tax=Stichopus japonicus TaxID=307972 RepID=A0A2G8JNU8_STIJA|nr:putative cryptochrome DASH-like [Apostichopus japonicus]